MQHVASPFAPLRSLLAAALVFTALPRSADAAESVAPTSARVEIHLHDAAGADIDLVGEHLRWNETHRLATTVGEHRHAVAIAIEPTDDGAVSVALTYERDGATVVERKRLTASMAEPVELVEGEASVLFVVRAEAPRAKLEIDGSDDPLGGI